MKFPKGSSKLMQSIGEKVSMETMGRLNRLEGRVVGKETRKKGPFDIDRWPQRSVFPDRGSKEMGQELIVKRKQRPGDGLPGE